jgi:hypothetical protein
MQMTSRRHYDSAASVTRGVRYALEQARPRPLRLAGPGAGRPAPDMWPGAREQSTRLALACRPTLHFGETLRNILAVRPERAVEAPPCWASLPRIDVIDCGVIAVRNRTDARTMRPHSGGARVCIAGLSE